MKKNRPGVLLTVLTTRERLAAVEELIFQETTSFGLRISEKQRTILDREFHNVVTPFGEVRVKIGRRDGTILQRSPEFESCRQLAEAADVPIKDVFAAATAASQSPGTNPLRSV